jgi:hypothetical protein
MNRHQLSKGIGRSKRGLIDSACDRILGTRNRGRRHRRRHGNSSICRPAGIIAQITMTNALGVPTRGGFTTRSRHLTRGLFLRSQFLNVIEGSSSETMLEAMVGTLTDRTTSGKRSKKLLGLIRSERTFTNPIKRICGRIGTGRDNRIPAAKAALS